MAMIAVLKESIAQLFLPPRSSPPEGMTRQPHVEDLAVARFLAVLVDPRQPFSDGAVTDPKVQTAGPAFDRGRPQVGPSKTTPFPRPRPIARTGHALQT
jgi:hypothetical protein